MVKNVTYKPKEYQTHYQNILLYVYILGHWSLLQEHINAHPMATNILVY